MRMASQGILRFVFGKEIMSPGSNSVEDISSKDPFLSTDIRQS